ncbi:hypothetical protein BH10ACT8_BH10ACT8_11240 [soil metagenome]
MTGGAIVPGRGAVLLTGTAVIRAAQGVRLLVRMHRQDGIRDAEVERLAELLATLAAEVTTSADGSPEVPHRVHRTELPTDELMAVKEIAAMYACTERNVRDLIAREVLTSGRRVHGRLFVDRAEVLDHHTQRKAAS